jgi:hypothetical protein
MTGPSAKSTDTYRLYELLDRFEELIEDMRELGVESLEQAEARIAEINEQIDEAESTGESPAS